VKETDDDKMLLMGKKSFKNNNRAKESLTRSTLFFELKDGLTNGGLLI
jgi:hypothetical protein